MWVTFKTGLTVLRELLALSEGVGVGGGGLFENALKGE